METVYANQTTIVSATFTRPGDTTAYSAGDAMGTAGGSLLQFIVPHPHGVIRSGRLWKSTTGTTSDDFRLLLFRKLPANNPIDNAAPTTSHISINDVDKYVGMMDFETIDHTLAAGLTYISQDMLPTTGIPFDVPNNVIYGLPVAITTYAPGSSEVFTINLEVGQ